MSANKTTTTTEPKTTWGDDVRSDDEYVDQDDKTEKVDKSETVDDSVVQDFPVYIIYSTRPISNIATFLSKFAKQASDIGRLRVDYSRGEASDRTIVMMAPYIFDALKAKGYMWTEKDKKGKTFDYNDFKIKQYVLGIKNRPTKRAERNIKFHLPKQINVDQVKEQLGQFIESLVKFGILKEEECHAVIPVADREVGNHVEIGFLFFGEDVHINNISLTFVLLQNSDWLDAEGDKLKGEKGLRRCRWTAINEQTVKMTPADRSYNKDYNKSKDYQKKDQVRSKYATHENRGKSRGVGAAAQRAVLESRPVREARPQVKEGQAKEGRKRMVAKEPEVAVRPPVSRRSRMANPYAASSSNEKVPYAPLNVVDQPDTVRK